MRRTRLGLCQDSDFTDDLEDSQSVSGGLLCFFQVEYLFQSVGYARSKLLSRTVLQSMKSFFLYTGLRMDELLTLDLLDIVIEVFRSINNNVQRNHTSFQETDATLHCIQRTDTTLHFKFIIQNVKRRQKIQQLNDVDYVPQTNILLKMRFSFTFSG